MAYKYFSHAMTLANPCYSGVITLHQSKNKYLSEELRKHHLKESEANHKLPPTGKQLIYPQILSNISNLCS